MILPFQGVTHLVAISTQTDSISPIHVSNNARIRSHSTMMELVFPAAGITRSSLLTRLRRIVQLLASMNLIGETTRMVFCSACRLPAMCLLILQASPSIRAHTQGVSSPVSTSSSNSSSRITGLAFLLVHLTSHTSLSTL